MDKLDKRQLLQSVTRLVEKPDIRALELSLIATLGKLVKAASVRLCQLHRDPDSPDQRMLVYSDPYERVAFESAPAFVECFNTQQKVVVPRDGRVLVIYPIKARREIVGFLTLDCENDDAHDHDVVSILLEFYNNYASLLYDNERDVLTGLLNRKSFYDKVLQVIGPLRDTPDKAAGACLAVIDIDHFKRINDKYGHLVGDETLILFARAMVEAFRGGDLLFRMGGEEFVVVLKEVDIASSWVVLERLRHTIEQIDFPQLGQLTVSIGVSEVLGTDLPMNTMDRADKALYYAKESGRNRVYAFENLVAEGKLSVVERKTDIELF
jgi:diguanylate cyclase (GGDEF)-like protein